MEWEVVFSVRLPLLVYIIQHGWKGVEYTPMYTPEQLTRSLNWCVFDGLCAPRAINPIHAYNIIRAQIFFLFLLKSQRGIFWNFPCPLQQSSSSFSCAAAAAQERDLNRVEKRNDIIGIGPLRTQQQQRLTRAFYFFAGLPRCQGGPAGYIAVRQGFPGKMVVCWL